MAKWCERELDMFLPVAIRYEESWKEQVKHAFSATHQMFKVRKINTRLMRHNYFPRILKANDSKLLGVICQEGG